MVRIILKQVTKDSFCDMRLCQQVIDQAWEVVWRINQKHTYLILRLTNSDSHCTSYIVTHNDDKYCMGTPGIDDGQRGQMLRS